MLRYTAVVTLLTVVFYFFLATRVAAARGRFGVKLPATSGHPDFDRVARVHGNTLEWLPIFLPLLWLCAFYLSDPVAAALGVLWLVGRVVYWLGYSAAVERRLPGFFIQSTACILLLIGAIVGLVRQWGGITARPWSLRPLRHRRRNDRVAERRGHRAETLYAAAKTGAAA